MLQIDSYDADKVPIYSDIQIHDVSEYYRFEGTPLEGYFRDGDGFRLGWANSYASTFFELPLGWFVKKMVVVYRRTVFLLTIRPYFKDVRHLIYNMHIIYKVPWKRN